MYMYKLAKTMTVNFLKSGNHIFFSRIIHPECKNL